LHFATRDLNDALARARRYAAELEEQRERLEETVKERTRDLTRRTRYLETTATVARDVALELDLQGLLSHVVALISERFAFYHTGIFLLDPGDEWAELRAASSAGGQRMLARRHRLQVGAEGIVGHVAGSGVHRVALDVGEDAVYFDNMDLPETRSEIALPLRVRGKIIGVLDVQSRESEAFSQEDVAVLQVLADQVAMAISNAHLFQRIDESMEAERRIYQELSRESWQELLRTQLALGFLSDARDTVPAGDLWRPEMKVALNTGQTTPGEGATTMAVPIKVRGQVIGVVDGRKPQDAGEWTQEEIELLEALTDQLNVALEGARLYQDSQRRAVREQMTREITDKMRRAVNVEGILQTAVDELFSVLGTSRAFVQLGVAPPAQGDEENSE
jgi:GAF domain-containing protein